MEKKLFIIILSIVFGIIGGVFGEIVTRAYLIENSFNIPFFGEIDYARNLSGTSNLIIRDAKKVVVEQDQKVIESAAAAGNSIAGIYKKDNFKNFNFFGETKPTENSVAFLNSAIGEAVIITSDGWLMSNFKPEEFKLESGKKNLDTKNATEAVLKNYLIVTKDGKIFSPDNFVVDKSSAISFWHINALDLPVAKFSFGNTISNGQLLLATNWQDWTWLSMVLAKTDNAVDGVISSDNFSSHLLLDQTPRKEFANSFLYNLNNEIVGLVNGGSSAESIDNYNAVINSFLKLKVISKPSLGVNYIDLSDLIGLDNNSLRQGALISKDKNNIAVVKGSAGEKAGLKEGDIIVAVNGTAINSGNGLNEITNRYLPGDEISITYQRSGQNKDVKLKLDASK